MAHRSPLSLALAGLAALSLIGALLLVMVARATPAPAAPSATTAAVQGAQLFVAKGCITCHSHSAVTGARSLGPIGPDLSAYRNDPAYLRTWLKDPAAVKPRTEMPNLGLTAEEIEALIAFLNDSAAK